MGRALAEPREQLQAGDPGDPDLDGARVAERLRALEVALPGRRLGLHVLPLRDVHSLPGRDDPADPALPGHPLPGRHPAARLRPCRLRHPDHGADLPQLLRHDPRRADGGGADGSRRHVQDVLVGRAPDLRARICRGADLAVHVDLERLPVRRLHHHRPGEVARDGRAEQHGRLAGDAVQPADGGGGARVAPDAPRLHLPRALLHARPDGRRPERLTRPMAEIVLQNLNKRYPNGFEAVNDLTLTIREAELLVLVGPSGCGKTTALRMVAGLEEITSGDLYIGGTRVNDVLERDRDIAMVFQNYALYPHMTVAQNIAFSLKLGRVPKEEIRRRVADTAGLLGLEALLDRRPKQLSGGQRQRVAMGRAIIRQPRAFLMDEPLSNLDAQLRVHMRGEIESLQKRLGVTTVYVTHDQIEAMTMGDRVAVLREGLLQQVDTPGDVYDRPANLFVAGFIGSPPMNLAEGQIAQDNGSLAVSLGEAKVPVPSSVGDGLGDLVDKK